MKAWVLALLAILIVLLLYLLFTAVSSTIRSLPNLMSRSYRYESFSEAIGAYISTIKGSATVVYKHCIPPYWRDAIQSHNLRISSTPDVSNAIYIDCDGCTTSIEFQDRDGLHDITHCPSSHQQSCNIVKTDDGAVLTLPFGHALPSHGTPTTSTIDRRELSSPVYDYYYAPGLQINSDCQDQIVKFDADDTTIAVYERGRLEPDCELLFTA